MSANVHLEHPVWSKLYASFCLYCYNVVVDDGKPLTLYYMLGLSCASVDAFNNIVNAVVIIVVYTLC